MRLLYSLAAAMLVTVLLPVLHASAFSTDPTSGTNPDGSPRFVDPDDQIRSFFLRRVGRKRGRLGRPKFSPSNRLPFAGWN